MKQARYNNCDGFFVSTTSMFCPTTSTHTKRMIKPTNDTPSSNTPPLPDRHQTSLQYSLPNQLQINSKPSCVAQQLTTAAPSIPSRQALRITQQRTNRLTLHPQRPQHSQPYD
jgi:hypothetical protein